MRKSKKERLGHLEFPDFPDDFSKDYRYDDYLHSHEWKTVRHNFKNRDGSDGSSFTEECSCGAIMRNPGGTINFRFGCVLVWPVAE